MSNYPVVEPRKIDKDEWGVFTDDPDLRSGDRVTVVARNGRNWTVVLERFIKKDLYGFYFSTVNTK